MDDSDIRHVRELLTWNTGGHLEEHRPDRPDRAWGKSLAPAASDGQSTGAYLVTYGEGPRAKSARDPVPRRPPRPQRRDSRWSAAYLTAY
ncbi:hypothetical protein GCM10009654_49500 [Streptomyces hebeiensis]|uniref:Uncharacterized protein n=1 Tax=Streptomyces hebeiensis TaxID=229486 RepID=A0ABN1V095_9ACTN